MRCTIKFMLSANRKRNKIAIIFKVRQLGKSRQEKKRYSKKITE